MTQFRILTILELVLRQLKIIEPYLVDLVEQERTAIVQLLKYGSKQTDQNSSN
jgi:hypothetical protein